jgi:hypothetical protein
MSSCVEKVEQWMASNRLRLNPAKTEVIWLGSAGGLKDCPQGPLKIAGVMITPSTCIRNLGVMVDGEISLTDHISQLTSVCYYYIRQLRTIRRSLTMETSQTLVQALVNSRLDYCNGVLTGMPKYSYDRLQSVLRAAARLVLQIPSSSSVSDLMRQKLHWLPFPQRVDFKIGCLAYKCQHGLAPTYLSTLCTRVSTVPGRQRLRSAASGQLVEPRTVYKTLGPRGFYSACPSVWNALPAALHDDSLSFGTFKRNLKTYLFSKT